MFSFFDTAHVSGSFKICTLSIIVNPVAPIVCNLVATPGRIGCLINTLICFKEGCGAVRFVWDQTDISCMYSTLLLQNSKNSGSWTWKKEESMSNVRCSLPESHPIMQEGHMLNNIHVCKFSKVSSIVLNKFVILYSINFCYSEL